MEPDFRRTNVLGDMMFNQNKWVCNECDYAGLMPSGEPDDDTEFEEKEQETVDRSAGSAYFKYFKYVFFPATVLYILYLIIL